MLFKPGTYDLQAQVGYYESVAGLGESPQSVNINGYVTSNQVDEYGALTTIFWRSLENLTENDPSTFQWAVSQGAPLRRLRVNGPLGLTNTACNYSSGGFISDSVVTGIVNSCSQQQYFTRNSTIGGWTGSAYNMVFAGVQGAPFPDYPANSYTVLPKTPVSREKPFLYVDASGNYNVFVPTLQERSAGPTWLHSIGTGYSLPIADFFIAQPSTPVATINAALASGKHLLLTPGIYPLTGAINIVKPDTIVMGLGYATLVPQTGSAAIHVADVDGVRIASLLIDAGPVNSPVLVQVGDPSSNGASHQADPSSLSDVFFRIGGATPGSATTTLDLESNHVLLDNIWAWRADHGNGVGWTSNTAAHGLVVNGNHVTALGLFVEHYQQSQVQWNGEHGETIFYQSELPYDPPSQAAWSNNGANGYASYAVAPSVTHHKAYGLGIYSYFNQNVNIVEDSVITVPDTSDVTVTDAAIATFGGSGSITHIVNGAGGPVQPGVVQSSYLPFYEGAPCTSNCPVVLKAPLNLTATVFSSNQINLSWQDSRPGVRYNLFRSTASGFVPSSSTLVYSGIAGTNYADTTVNPAATYFYVVEAVNDRSTSVVSNEVSATIPSAGAPISSDVVAINVGGGATANYVADRYFLGGTATGSNAAINTSLVAQPAPQSVYQSNRYGVMSYSVPGLVPNKKYIINLHFAETYYTRPGQRQFNVQINGKFVLKNFDTVGTAGAVNTAVVESFTSTPDPDGVMRINFTTGAADNPQVNGIEIGVPCTSNCPALPAPPQKLTATQTAPGQVSLNWTPSATPGVLYNVFRSQQAGFAATAATEIASGVTSASFTDTTANPATTYFYTVAAINDGGLSAPAAEIRVITRGAGGTIGTRLVAINAGGAPVDGWLADEDFEGGNTASTGNQVSFAKVATPAPEAVYQTNRYGSMTYTIPNLHAGTTYIVNLHFAETYWSAPGERLFNVSINGVPALQNYDIFASAGGEFIATEQSFTTTADAAGNITIQFTPGPVDLPQINGIEVGTRK